MDAAIAAMFCNGVYSPHSLGIGGGFFMTLYIAETGEVVTLNAREFAPEAAYEDMYGGDTHLSKVGNIEQLVLGDHMGLSMKSNRCTVSSCARRDQGILGGQAEIW